MNQADTFKYPQRGFNVINQTAVKKVSTYKITCTKQHLTQFPDRLLNA